MEDKRSAVPTYEQETTIGKKDSRSGGRTALYILNRRLAPIWTLDPTSFAGYLFVQNKLLEDAMVNPDSLLRRLRKTYDEADNTENGYIQLSLFSPDDESLYSVELGDENV